MIDPSHELPIARQAAALGISRGSVYYLPRSVPASDLAIMRRMDELHLDFPFAGSRMLRDLLANNPSQLYGPAKPLHMHRARRLEFIKSRPVMLHYTNRR